MAKKSKESKLKLVLKFKWFDMIEDDIKKFEYRQIKESVVSILFDWRHSGLTRAEFTDKLKTEKNSSTLWCYLKRLDSVVFYRACSRTRKTMEFEIKSVSIGKMIPQWGFASDEDVFCIELGKRITNK